MNSDNDSENEESGEEKRWGGTGGRILLVDASEGMWRLRHDPATEEDLLPLTVAFHSSKELVRRLMVDAPTHLLGMAIFGTRKNDDKGLENVVQLLELKQPSVEDMKTLKRICLDVSEVKNKWGSADKYNFADALWQASRMFSSCKKKMSSQSVTILSCFTEPDASVRRSILKKASDLHSLGIKINLINVSDAPVDEDSFFIEFGSIISNQPMSEYEFPPPLLNPDDILSVMYESTNSKSASARIKFCLGGDVQIGVGLYHLCKTKNAPKKVTLHRETNALVDTTSSTTVTIDGISKPVLLSELAMYQQFGDRRIELTHSELTQLRKFGGAPQMKLLGFRSTASLDMAKYYLKQSAFLYPDEASVIGSTKLFKCLRDRCIAKECIPICIIVPRWYTHPRLVALVPQMQIIQHNVQKQSDGFHVIYLPYSENFKDVPVHEISSVSEEQLECAKKIIKKLKIIYDPNNFENPKLQTLYNAIEALAFDESEPRPVEDTTIPNIESQDDRLGELTDMFNEMFGPFGMKATKRARSNNDESSTSRPKKSVLTPDLQILKVRLDNKLVHKYTVEELKSILKWRKPPNVALTGLKKEELIRLVYAHCDDS